MLVVHARVHHCHTDTSPEVAFLTKLVNPGHDVRIVIVIVARRIPASEAVRGNTTADGGAMGNAGNLSPRRMKLPDRRDLLHYRP
jgi:hypothetical protein